MLCDVRSADERVGVVEEARSACDRDASERECVCVDEEEDEVDEEDTDEEEEDEDGCGCVDSTDDEETDTPAESICCAVAEEEYVCDEGTAPTVLLSVLLDEAAVVAREWWCAVCVLDKEPLAEADCGDGKHE